MLHFYLMRLRNELNSLLIDGIRLGDTALFHLPHWELCVLILSFCLLLWLFFFFFGFFWCDLSLGLDPVLEKQLCRITPTEEGVLLWQTGIISAYWWRRLTKSALISIHLFIVPLYLLSHSLFLPHVLPPNKILDSISDYQAEVPVLGSASLILYSLRQLCSCYLPQVKAQIKQK